MCRDNGLELFEMEPIPSYGELLSWAEPLAILCGAGVSLSRPSNLLDGRSFMTQVLRRVRPPGVLRASLFQTLNRPRDVRSRPGHFLRFELLMKALQDSELDQNLSVLDCLECDWPNKNHFLLGGLVRAGCVVMTTNFDTLIEQAYQDPNPGNWPQIRVVIFRFGFWPIVSQ
jgi:NAD-dependent SIR2 family protein deacetylase